jgi:hypothetical protein
LVELAPKIALFGVGVAAGVGIAQLLDPVAPPVGRLMRRLRAFVRL